MRKRIIIISQNYPPDVIGGATRNVEMAKLMKEFGSEVVVIANHPSYPFGKFPRTFRPVKKTERDGIMVYHVWTYQPHGNPAAIGRMMYHILFSFNALLLSSLLVRKDDVLITSIPPDTNIPIGHFLKKLKGCRWVLDVRDLWQEAAAELGFISGSGALYDAMTDYKISAYKEVDVTGHVNMKILKVLKERYQLASETVHHPNGVDVSKYVPRPSECATSLIYVSNFGFSHDVDQLMRLIDGIATADDVKLTIIGEGERRSEVMDHLKRNGIKNVELTGLLKREEVPARLCSSRAGLILINPHESFDCAIPIKAIEYMACGIPVLGIAGPGTREFFQTNRCGKIFLPEEFDQLIDYVHSIDAHCEELKEMGRNGRRTAEEQFDKRKVTRRFWETITK